MKISLVSDLHLDCGYQELPGGEVLILAGDICEARDFRKEYHSTRLNDAKHGTYKFWDFFYHECAKYEKVFYVMGNHEHYGGRFDRTYAELSMLLPSYVQIMEKECVEYKGVLFLGATLWTDCDRGNPITLHAVRFGMNDYRVIKNHYADKDIYNKLTPEHTIGVHRKTLDYFHTVLSDKKDMPTVVITHHAPSHLSIHPRYQGHAINAAYVSDLSEFILNHENIRFWVHGHNHDAFDYKIGNTRILSNPRGYVGYEDTSKFNPNFTFEIES